MLLKPMQESERIHRDQYRVKTDRRKQVILINFDKGNQVQIIKDIKCDIQES